MALTTQTGIHGEAKKTNERLDAILAEMRQMNRWLAHIAGQLTPES